MKYMKLLLILSTISSAQAMMGEGAEQWQGERPKTPAAKAQENSTNIFYTYVENIYNANKGLSEKIRLYVAYPGRVVDPLPDATVKHLISHYNKNPHDITKGWIDCFSFVNKLKTGHDLLKDFSSNLDPQFIVPDFKNALLLKTARDLNNKQMESKYLKVLNDGFNHPFLREMLDLPAMVQAPLQNPLDDLRNILGLPAVVQAPDQQSFNNLSTVKGPPTDQSRHINNFTSASQAYSTTLPHQSNPSWMSEEEEPSTLIYMPPSSSNEPVVKVPLKRTDLPPIVDKNKITETLLKFYNAAAELPKIKDAEWGSIFITLKINVVNGTLKEPVPTNKSDKALFDVLVKDLIPSDPKDFEPLKSAWIDAVSISDRSGIAGSLKKQLESKSRDESSKLILPHFKAALLLKAADDVSKDPNFKENEDLLKNLHDLSYTDAFINSFTADLSFDTSKGIASHEPEEFFDAVSSLDTAKPAEDVKQQNTAQFVDDLISLVPETPAQPPQGSYIPNIIL